MMLGGVICGYWATGSVGIATNPVRTMTMDSTAAKIGRLMKKRENTAYAQSGQRELVTRPAFLARWSCGSPFLWRRQESPGGGIAWRWSPGFSRLKPGLQRQTVPPAGASFHSLQFQSRVGPLPRHLDFRRRDLILWADALEVVENHAVVRLKVRFDDHQPGLFAVRPRQRRPHIHEFAHDFVVVVHDEEELTRLVRPQCGFRHAQHVAFGAHAHPRANEHPGHHLVRRGVRK